MQYRYSIEGRNFTFEVSEDRLKGWVCHCVEMPGFVFEGSTSKEALQTCLNKVSDYLGAAQVMVKHAKRTRKVYRRKENTSQKPWWQFW